MHIDPARVFKPAVPRFTVVLDAEVIYDDAAHARYQAAERFDPTDTRPMPARKAAKDPRVTPRWPCQRITALSWLVMTDGVDGLRPLRLETASRPEQAEADIIRSFFRDMESLKAVELVTWGGHHSDLPQILLAAMVAGVPLPSNLAGLAYPWRREASGHIDLSSRVTGGADAVHLAEVAAALNIPAKLTCRPNLVSQLMGRGKWSGVRSVVEGDVMTTALILMLWRHLSGETMSRLEAVRRLTRFIAQNCAHRPYAADWVRFGEAELDAAFAAESAKVAHLAPPFRSEAEISA